MKNTKNLKLYLFVFLLYGSFYSQAQQIDTVFSKLSSEYQQEKLYLHFDRTVYTPGETIWFKAYLFTDNYPSQLSKTIYAELVDDNGKVIDRKIAPVLMSSAASSFDIPANLLNAVVYVRAYTKWMLNFDSSFIYTRAIPIATLKKPVKETAGPDILLHFFPEGGDLVQDIPSRVAFKGTDNTGMPEKISGVVVDNTGNKIIYFESIHDGMGSFQLLPKSGITYKAIWKDKTGKTHETVLPPVKPVGVALEVNSNERQIEIKIKRSPDGTSAYPFIYVIAQMNHQRLYKAKANLDNSSLASGTIPLANLPAGIVQVTLFTPDEKPIAERITFINQSQSSFITDLNAALKDLGDKKKNVIQIDVPDTIPTNLSVSVTDADLNPLQPEENIFSNVLLTSDLKGYVHQPSYYFSSEADSVVQHLDLVMMTNGWRRFNWEKVLANNWPKLLYRPENFLAIEGQVSGLNKTLLANKEVNGIIEFKDSKREFINTPVENNGRFVFDDMVFYDTAKLFYQFNNDKNKNLTSRSIFDIKHNLLRNPLRLKPDSTLKQGITKPDMAIVSKNIEIYKEQLSAEELQKLKTLKEVVVTAKPKSKEQVMEEEYTSGLFSGGQSRIFLTEDDPIAASSQSVLNYLQGMVAGLQINMGGSQPSITRRGSPTALFINEIEMDASSIQNISMNGVAMIKVFDPPFFGVSGGGAGGAIAVYLKKGGGAQTSKGLDYVSIPGYSLVKEFYSPDYSKPDKAGAMDYRKTLYWNPFVLTDKKNRRILLPFYNNDITKKIKIIIEGCNEDGKLTRIEKLLQ